MLAKSKWNSIDVLIYKALIDLNISHDEFVLMNNVPKDYDNFKEKIKNLKTWKLIKTFDIFINNVTLECQINFHPLLNVWIFFQLHQCLF